MKCPSVTTLSVCAVLLLLITVFEVWMFTKLKRIKIIRTHMYIVIELLIVASIRYIMKRLNTVIRTNSIIAFGFIFKTIVLVVLLTSLVTMVMTALPATIDPYGLSLISTYCLGVLVFLTTSLAIFDVIMFVFRQLSKLIGRTSRTPSMNRNEIKIRTLLSLLCALVLTLYGAFGASSVNVVHLNVPISGLNAKLNGTTIVQLSDIHLGPFNGRKAMEGLVKRVNSLTPDIVAITGDLADSSFQTLKEAVSPLAKIQSKKGVFYSTGNHEYYTGDVDNWINLIPQFNVTPLMNKRVCLYKSRDSSHGSCDGGLYVAGLEDIETRRGRYGAHSMDLHAALSGRDKGVPTIVLAHQPWAAAEAIMWKDVRLVLSGHTHGGQIFPATLLVYLYNPFFVGLYEPRPSVFVHVNPGTFYYVLPFRHFFQPEITKITLIAS